MNSTLGSVVPLVMLSLYSVFPTVGNYNSVKACYVDVDSVDFNIDFDEVRCIFIMLIVMF